MSDAGGKPTGQRSEAASARSRAAAARSPLTPGTEAARADRPRAIAAAVLLVLVFGHVLPGLLAGNLLFGSDWNALAARWAHLGWRIWDIATVLAGAGYVGLLVRSRWRARSSHTRAILLLLVTLALTVTAVFCILTLGAEFR